MAVLFCARDTRRIRAGRSSGYAVVKVRDLIYSEPFPARRDAVARWPSTPSLASGLHGRDAPAGRVCG